MTDKLRELAMAAGGGEWHRTSSGDPHWLCAVRDSENSGVAWCGRLPQSEAHKLSAFIAAANPAAVLSLLDERDALRAECERLRAALAQPEQQEAVVPAKVVIDAIEQWKGLWVRVPAFGNKVNRATREAITISHNPLFILLQAAHSAAPPKPAAQQEGQPVNSLGDLIAPATQKPQDAELAAALGWPGGISEPVLDRAALLRIVAERCQPAAQQPFGYGSEIAKIIRHARAGNVAGVESYASLLADKLAPAHPETARYLRRVIAGDDGELVHPTAQQPAKGEPMFWVRIRSDGCYEGPLHNESIEKVRRESGAWSPLYLHPPAAQQTAAPLAPLSVEDIDDVVMAGSHRNAAGGIYATRVYQFADDIIAEFCRVNGIAVKGTAVPRTAIPTSIIDAIGEYGAACRNSRSEPEILRRWGNLIDAIRAEFGLTVKESDRG